MSGFTLFTSRRRHGAWLTTCTWAALAAALSHCAASEDSDLDKRDAATAPVDGQKPDSGRPGRDAGQGAEAGAGGDGAVNVDAGAGDAGGGPGPVADAGTPSPRQGMWLKGDFHVHSNHSTDAADSPVADVIKKAEDVGFDFFVITDHDNHVEGKLTTWGDPAYRSDKLALMFGTEWTTGKGHANIFGSEPFDHAPLWALRDGPGADSIAAAHAQGLHFSVNHPSAKDLWELGFELPYDSMEVWTAVFLVPNSNEQAIKAWDDLLLGGRRIPARGGSDSHHQKDAESLLFNIGNPTTWVFAREKTGAAVLEGLASGHASLSYAPSAERVDFTADADGDGTFETIVGDNLTNATGSELTFRIVIEGFRSGAKYEVKVLKNGAQLMALNLDQPSATFTDIPSADARSHYRVEVRGDTPDAPIVSSLGFGRFVAMTNPIYVGFP